MRKGYVLSERDVGVVKVDKRIEAYLLLEKRRKCRKRKEIDINSMKESNV